MYHLNSNTLAYYKKSAALTPQDLRSTPLTKFAKTMREYMSSVSPTTVTPETEAVKFYYLNHAFAELCSRYDEDDLLPPEAKALAQTYLQELSSAGQRMICYTLLIVTRESRHLHGSSSFMSELESKFGSTYVSFLNGLPSSSGGAATKIKNSPPDMDFGTYISGVTHVFDKGGFSGGYGGKPWANIARTLERFIHGQISMEMFMDTAWTLAHNNGPMFNKGMLYDMYQASCLYAILDAQSGGQIPGLVNDCMDGHYEITGVKQAGMALKSVVTAALPEMGVAICDWEGAVALGGCKKDHTGHISKQHKVHGESTTSIEAKKAEASKFYIADGEYANIVQRSAA